MCGRKRTTDRRFCGVTCRSVEPKQANRSFSSLLLQANLRINSRHCCVGLSACGVDLEQGSDPPSALLRCPGVVRERGSVRPYRREE